jgi:predicted permease
VAIFTVVNAVLLRPLPYPEPDRIVVVNHHAPALNLPDLSSSPGLIARYRETARSLTRMAAYQRRTRNLTGSGSPERVSAIVATPELFDVLAVSPAIGRRFHQSDAEQHAAPVAILTHALWQSRFGSDPGVLGRLVRLDGQEVEIVGVMPPRFVFPDPETKLLIPLWLDPHAKFGEFGMNSLARLAPGVTLDAARREIGRLQRRITEWFPDVTPDTIAKFGWSVTVQPLRDTVVKDISRTLWILLGSVALVLLIAGANVANLFLVRAESRQREVAVRSALGATRARVAATFLAESLVLALSGGVAGSLIAAAGIRILVANGPADLPRLHEVSFDGTVAAFAVALSLLAALVVGCLPVLRLGHQPFSTLLRDAGRGITPGGRHRVRQLLIAGQVAIALVLLVASGLVLKSAARLHAVDPGFTVEGVLTAGVSLGAQPDRQRAVNFYHRVLDQLLALPGVTAAGAGGNVPVSPSSMQGSSVGIESRPRPDNALPPVAMYFAVTAGYFDALGIPVLDGRAPARTDAEQRRPVVWVNRTFARQLLDGRAIGERIRFGDDESWLEIAGVVGDVRTFGLQEDIRPMAYLPLSHPTVSADLLQVVLRTPGDPSSLASSLRAAVDRVDPAVPLTTVQTMEEVVRASLAQMAFTMTLLTIAAGVALVLGIVGLYGVISYIVTQRTSEIGVRLAVGAQPADVRAMVLRQGLSVTLLGVVVGLAAAAGVTHVLGSLLFEVSARDPATFAAVALVLTGVSAVASYVPARRAAGIDPLVALRQDG